MVMQVNIQARVNSASIRREMHNGREHFVIPSYTLPFDVVMNGGLYPKSEIVANFEKLEGTLAPLGHPTVNGAFVSAFSPEGINVGHIGAWNRNTKLVGNRVYTEKWLDIAFAANTKDGPRLIERLEAIEKGEQVDPIHTSVAAFLDREPAVNADGYQWTARIKGLDHDAILLDQPGAATPTQGVGLMVNADQAVPLLVNAGALEGESFREKERRIEQAAKARFAVGDEDYVWVADFTDTQAVLMRNGGTAELYGYKIEGGKVVFDATGSPVERQESWVSRIPLVNHIRKFFTNHQARPDNTLEGEMPFTTEEKAELTNDISKAFAANLAEQLKPLTAKIDALEANHKSLSDSLTANARAEESEKRAAVAAKHGDVVANALSGDALDVMFKSLGTAAPIGSGLAPNSSEKPKFDEVPD